MINSLFVENEDGGTRFWGVANVNTSMPSFFSIPRAVITPLATVVTNPLDTFAPSPIMKRLSIGCSKYTFVQIRPAELDIQGVKAGGS